MTPHIELLAALVEHLKNAGVTDDAPPSTHVFLQELHALLDDACQQIQLAMEVE